MRKINLIFLGALAGAGATALVSQSHLLSSTSAVAASAETYRQLSLFGDVFEKVRSDYVEKPEEAKLIEVGHQRHADLARSAFELHGPEELPRHAGADARRVRRPRHRGHDGGRPRQGRDPDRRDAGGPRRPPRQRRHHAYRRRAGAGPDAQPGGRQDARPDQLDGAPQDQAQGEVRSVRGLADPRHHPDPAGPGPQGRRGRRLSPPHPVQRADLSRG